MSSLLHTAALFSLAIAGLCALVIAVDGVRHPQKMVVMDFVWPLSALFGSLPWLWFYLRHGRPSARPQPDSFAVAVAKATSHCGSGCTLGDLCAEGLAAVAPSVLVVFGWHRLFGERVFAAWALDTTCAFAIGIVFQYFTIAPMRHLGFRQGLWAALKADTLSLAAWQLGMIGFMAWANFGLSGGRLDAGMPEFWLAMQFAMLCGFATSWPVNGWLLRRGWKERM